MTLTTPDNINVFSQGFKDHYLSLCEEVVRFSSIAGDVERMRAKSNHPADPPQIVFFEILGGSGDCTWTPTTYLGCEESGASGYFEAIEYTGTIFLMRGAPRSAGEDNLPCKIVISTEGVAYDLATHENHPCILPDGVSPVAQTLKRGTVVMGLMTGNNVVTFSSNMPRLGAECP